MSNEAAGKTSNFRRESNQELITLPGDGSIHARIVFSPYGNMIGSMSTLSRILKIWQAPSLVEIEKVEDNLIPSRTRGESRL